MWKQVHARWSTSVSLSRCIIWPTSPLISACICIWCLNQSTLFWYLCTCCITVFLFMLYCGHLVFLQFAPCLRLSPCVCIALSCFPNVAIGLVDWFKLADGWMEKLTFVVSLTRHTFYNNQAIHGVRPCRSVYVDYIRSTDRTVSNSNIFLSRWAQRPTRYPSAGRHISRFKVWTLWDCVTLIFNRCSSLDFTINRFFMKLFRTNNIDIVKES